MNFKKNGKVFRSKFVGSGPSSYNKRIYRAAVSQSLGNTTLTHYTVHIRLPTGYFNTNNFWLVLETYKIWFSGGLVKTLRFFVLFPSHMRRRCPCTQQESMRDSGDTVSHILKPRKGCGQWPASRPDRFNPRKKAVGMQWIGGRMCLGSGLDDLEKRPCWELDHDSSDAQPVM